jgi:hypothetical protein
MVMESYTGRLKELGQAKIQHMRTYSLFVYSYIEVGDKMIKNLGCYGGLDGKLQHELGKEITLHVKNGFVEAVESSEGKTYSSARTNRSMFLLVLPGVVFGFGVMLAGFKATPPSFFSSVYGLAFGALILFVTYRLYKFFDEVENAGANLPNAIPIPRA